MSLCDFSHKWLCGVVMSLSLSPVGKKYPNQVYHLPFRFETLDDGKQHDCVTFSVSSVRECICVYIFLPFFMVFIRVLFGRNVKHKARTNSFCFVPVYLFAFQLCLFMQWQIHNWPEKPQWGNREWVDEKEKPLFYSASHAKLENLIEFPMKFLTEFGKPNCIITLELFFLHIQ